MIRELVKLGYGDYTTLVDLTYMDYKTIIDNEIALENDNNVGSIDRMVRKQGNSYGEY
jgi:hypothetical protein